MISITFGMPWKKNVQCGFCIEFDRISLIVDDASCLLFFIERPTCPGHGHLVLATLPWISTYFPCRPSVDIISIAIWWLQILLGVSRLTMFARTAPPKKTMCLLLGGSSILTLNFCMTLVSDCKYDIQYNAVSYAQSLGVSLQDSGEPKLLELLFQSAGKTGVHAATSGQDNGLV